MPRIPQSTSFPAKSVAISAKPPLTGRFFRIGAARMAFFADAVSNYIVRHQGQFLVGARVQFFDAGTNSVRTMYADGQLNTPLDPTEILSNANARFPPIWGQGGDYRALITAPGGAVIEDMDYLPGDVTAGGGGGGGGGSTSHAVGDIQPSILSGVRAGWVRANARTIGSAASGASERADDDCEDLFVAMWPNTLFTVSGGRGDSAPADWTANKTVTLPDARLCALIGADGMGNTATNLFSSLTFTSGTAASVGSRVGAATVTLTTATMPGHTHTGSTDTAGLHSHVGITDSQGNHSHTGVTTAAGLHAHNVNVNASATVIFAAAGGGNVPLSGATNYVTDTQGSHSHDIATTTNGAHAHFVATENSGAHAHGVTTTSTGGDGAHPNVQNSLLCTFFIKL